MLTRTALVAPSSLLGLLLAATVACSPAEPAPPRVIVLGLDGLDAGVVDRLIAEGELPNLARLRSSGASGVLTADLPMLSPILWTTMATGRTPDEHGIGSFTVERAGEGGKRPVTSTMRRVDAVWNIASAAGRRVGVVGWWASWPPEAVNGVIVSDHACFHLLFGEGQRGAARTEGAIFPPERAAELEALIRRPDDVGFAEASRYVTVDPAELERPFDFADDISHLRWALATADSYSRIGRRIWEVDGPELLMVYIEGTDSVSHLFGHLFRAGDLAGDLAEQQRRYGRAVEEIYRRADELVGEYAGLMDDRTALIVLSDHGFKLGKLHDDPTITTSMRRVSDAFHDLDGILFMAGAGVRAGVRIEGARQADITPTILELLGLPASDEMNGRVLVEALTDPEPLPRVASYETADRPAAGASDAGVDREVLAHLEALGYLEADESPPATSRSEADMLLRAGRFEEAAAAFASLLAADPENPALHLNLAVALSSLGRDDEALEALDRAGALAPADPKVAFNRGLILERRGDGEAAAEMYRATLRADGDHEGARAGLERVTGSARVYEPRNEAERRAAELAVTAAQEARRGDYEAAGRLLDEAEGLAPDLPMVHQYCANVAYLAGDLETAIAALERALALEPDNARVRKNLETLRARRAGSVD
jgi:tetratricopeptide (TPR) repeat protein